MAYCTHTDIRKVLPGEALVQLTDDEGLGTVDQARVDEAIAQADGEIDTYLGGRYTVPLSSVPAIIRRCSCDMAVYTLYSRTMEEVPETRETRYRDAVRVLTRISEGKMDLPLSGAGSDGFASGVLVTSHFEEDNA